MANPVIFNGVTYSIPVTGDTNWGTDVTTFLTSLAQFTALNTSQIQASRVVSVGTANVTTSDYAVYVDAAPCNLTLPAAMVGQIFAIKDITQAASLFPIVVFAPGGQTIDGQAAYSIANNGGHVILQFRGSNTWSVLSSSSGATGTAYQVITYDSSSVLLISNTFVRVDTANAVAAFTLTLPAGPQIGQSIIIKDTGGQLNRFPVTLAANSGQTVDGQASYIITQNRTSLTVVYSATNEWSVI